MSSMKERGQAESERNKRKEEERERRGRIKAAGRPGRAAELEPEEAGPRRGGV